ncbi:PREDICTED: toll-interacting protein-like [Nicrophorus vespilloides]|uniref:Toll-interacting protein-like n=1 Tax=Nicrophorus vespilloides TaxID=110193 RepID=A0ABM1MM46_NICVS|nr:PREDICTED: toll-interacting protein-like [Nicrophorus vespilloides]
MNIVAKAMASAVIDKVKDRKVKVFLGPLPDDFLRITGGVQKQQEAVDRQTALALQHQFVVLSAYPPKLAGRFSITIAQAKLVKNYGITRMDPYVRVRMGHAIYETHTDPNGGKNPRWNKVIQCLLPHGVNTVSIDIYDERSLYVDELIAWTQFTIPKQVLLGETQEEWYPLSGKQGEGLEGSINLVLSYVLNAPPSMQYPPVMMLQNVSGGRVPAPVYSAPPANNPALPSVPVLSETEFNQIEEMFPNIDKEVIKSVFEANRGNKDGTINSLLQMCE